MSLIKVNINRPHGRQNWNAKKVVAGLQIKNKSTRFINFIAWIIL